MQPCVVLLRHAGRETEKSEPYTRSSTLLQLLILSITHSRRNTTARMSYTPLMKNEEWPSQDDYSEDSQPHLNGQQSRLPRKTGYAGLLGVVVAVIVAFAAGVASTIAFSRRGEGLLFSQTMAPSPVSRDLDITFHETQFEGRFMDENIFRLKGNNETDAAWEALGIDCKIQLPCGKASFGD